MTQRVEMQLGGRTLVLEAGRLAKQANAAVTVRYGDTVVLCTVTASPGPKDLDFFPLTVNYEERLYAVGKIPGGFIKREGRPSEKAILASRLTDRPIRPLFPEGFRNDVQIVDLVMSVDQDCPPQIAAMIGTSAALSISDVPFNGPIGGVIVGRVDGKFVINPTVEQESRSDIYVVVAGTKDAIMMVEAEADEVAEEVMLEAIMFGHDEIRKIVAVIDELVQVAGKPKMSTRTSTATCVPSHPPGWWRRSAFRRSTPARRRSTPSTRMRLRISKKRMRTPPSCSATSRKCCTTSSRKKCAA